MARTKGSGPNQSDLAAALGLSVSTISRALAGSPSISAQVRDQVAKAAIELGYRKRSAGERSILESVLVLVGIHDVNSTLSWVYQEMLVGLSSGAQQMSLPLKTHLTAETEGLPAGIDALLNPSTGLVFLGLVPSQSTIDELAERDIASVIVNGVDPSLRVDSVSPANYFGGRIVADHLAQLGHRRVAFVGGPKRWTLTRRLHGFRDRLEEIYDGETCIVDSLYLHPGTSETYLEQLIGWLPRCLDQISAIFCYNDSIALMAIEALSTMGLSVPEDISVTGFDDMPMATISSPALTTFRLDWRGLGSEALQFLELRRSQPIGPAREMQFGGSLIARGSTGPVNAKFA